VFVGHFALGFAAKETTPKTSPATLFVAAQLADVQGFIVCDVQSRNPL
jgi:hypothetical protein